MRFPFPGLRTFVIEGKRPFTKATNDSNADRHRRRLYCRCVLGLYAHALQAWCEPRHAEPLSLANGEREIAGNPVNIASKLSEDSGLEGILVEDSVTLGALAQQGEPFRLTISKVELTGRRIPV
jgi:hypothetical protein